jgi:hypothetical protein
VASARDLLVVGLGLLDDCASVSTNDMGTGHVPTLDSSLAVNSEAMQQMSANTRKRCNADYRLEQADVVFLDSGAVDHKKVSILCKTLNGHCRMACALSHPIDYRRIAALRHSLEAGDLLKKFALRVFP